MKALIISLIVAFSMLIISTIQPSNTLKNLKTGYNIEGQTAYRYRLFAQKAKEEGHDEVAELFTAVSKSEEVQMKNQLTLLNEIGDKPDPLNYEKVKVETTKKNLKEAIRDESRDEKYTYIQFALDALKEKNQEAKEGFIHSMNAQLEHKNLFKQALKNLGDNANYDYYISNQTGMIQAVSPGSPAPTSLFEDETYVKINSKIF